jgi:hypothetical protein
MSAALEKISPLSTGISLENILDNVPEVTVSGSLATYISAIESTPTLTGRLYVDTSTPSIHIHNTATTSVSYPYFGGLIHDTSTGLGTLIGTDISQTALNSFVRFVQNIDNTTGSTNASIQITITGTTANINVFNVASPSHAVLTHKDVLRKNVSTLMKTNLLIKTERKSSSRQMLPLRYTPQEQKARDSLRDMLTEEEWRRYVTNGFIMVRGGSGYWYQIFADNSRLQVYKNNKKTHTVCIHTDKTCPPSDHVINMKVLIEIDEASLWANSNVTSLSEIRISLGNFAIATKPKPLVEEYRKLKTHCYMEHALYTVSGTCSTVALAC